MICIYPPTATEWTTNGWITCQPTKCIVKEVAGGSYELEMEHPLTMDERWTMVDIGYIVKAPVPMRQSPYIDTIHVDGNIIYTANAKTSLYSKPARPEGVSTSGLSAWNRSTTYAVGNRVLYLEVPYECIAAIGPREITIPVIGTVWTDTSGILAPSSDTTHWRKLAVSNGSRAVTAVAQGEEVSLIEYINNGWFRARNEKKVEGYASYSDFTYTRTEDFDQEELAKRVIRDQCFRIVRREIDSANRNLKIYARHISYDYLGLILDGSAKVNEETISTSIVRIQAASTQWMDATQAAAMYVLTPSILTNLTGGSVTQDWSWQNPIYALLDPSAGLVPMCKAKVVRDNYDIFVLDNSNNPSYYQLWYGRNMMGVQWKRSSEDVITHVLPRGKNQDGSTRLLNPPLVASADAFFWPVPFIETMDVADAEVGKEITLPDETKHTQTEADVDALLLETAQNRFLVDHCDRQKIELQVDFLTLGDSKEYAQYKGMELLCLYDMVDIVHRDIGLQESAQVIEYEWDAILERYNKIKLGDPFDYNFRQVAGFQLMPYSIDQTRLTPSLLAMITKGAEAASSQEAT